MMSARHTSNRQSFKKVTCPFKRNKVVLTLMVQFEKSYGRTNIPLGVVRSAGDARNFYNFEMCNYAQ